MASTLSVESFWIEKSRYNTAERQYYESLQKELQLSQKAKCVNNSIPNESLSTEGQLNGYTNKPAQAAAKILKLKKSKKIKARKNEIETASTIMETSATTGLAASPNRDNGKIVLSLGNEHQQEVSADLLAKKHKKKNKSATSKKATEKLVNQLHTSQNSYTHSTDQLKNNSNFSKPKGNASNSQCTLVSEIAKAREHIKNSLEKMDGIATLAASPVSTEILDRITAVEKENANLRQMVEKLQVMALESQTRLTAHHIAFQQLVGGTKEGAAVVAAAAANAKAAAASALAAAKKLETEDDDGVDLFASDSEEESEDAARIREERLAAYAAKKSKKPALIAKSSLVLDVKPWDDETDLKVMETEIRKITSDGLLWGASKFVPVAFGIQKLSISCVVEDEKVSIDWLTEEIEKLEDFVQSVDVAAFNKI